MEISQTSENGEHTLTWTHHTCSVYIYIYIYILKKQQKKNEDTQQNMGKYQGKRMAQQSSSNLNKWWLEGPKILHSAMLFQTEQADTW